MRVCCKATAFQLPPFFTYTRVNMACPETSFPPMVPLTSTLPVTTAVSPYTRTFISESSSEVSLFWPDLNPLTICDLSDILPYTQGVVVVGFFLEFRDIALDHSRGSIGLNLFDLLFHALSGGRTAQRSENEH